MKISVLTENFAGADFQAEHGLSYLIEHENFELLFDTGHSDLFLRNAQKLNINLSDVDTVVLSHGHWDHGNGLKYLKNKTLITHPNSFIKRYRKSNNSYIGLDKNFNFYKKNFNLLTSSKPYKITNNIIFLGEIPRICDFETTKTPYIDDKGQLDIIPDDSAIVLTSNDEISIITGCSHSGICNIVNYAIKITAIPKIKLIIGGFHLKNNDERTKKTIKCLKNLMVQNLYPSHCTQLPALSAFYNDFKIKQLKTGDILTF